MNNIKYLLILSYIFLNIAFVIGIDPNGGALTDFQTNSIIIKDFANDFYNTLFNYDKYSTRHSPIFYSLLSLFYRLELTENSIRLISLHLGLILPYIFYKCLKLKYKNFNKKFLLAFAILIIVSPTFLSLTIWPDSRIFGLLFFCLSIFQYLKFEKKKKFKNVIKCIFFYVIASYVSPNFSVFSFFYFYNFCLYYRLKKETVLIFFLNIILSLPAIIYLFTLENFFFLKTAVPSNEIEIKDFFNFSNKILIISSIIFFYILPFIITKSIKINYLDTKNLIISLLSLFFLSFNFSYNYTYTGGGIFFKTSNFLFGNNILFFILCLFALMTILSLVKNNINNLILFFLLILNNPQYTIYHKYYDPLLLILFLTLFKLNLVGIKLFNIKSLIIFYLYTLLFLLLNFLK